MEILNFNFMKLYAFIFFVSLLYSCQNSTTLNVHTQTDIQKTFAKRNLTSKDDMLFLSFWPEMSLNEYSIIKDSLIKDSVLGVFDSIPVYIIFIQDSSARGLHLKESEDKSIGFQMTPKFNDDKLYAIELVDLINGGYPYENELLNLYKKKYGKPTSFVINEFKDKIYSWVLPKKIVSMEFSYNDIQNVIRNYQVLNKVIVTYQNQTEIDKINFQNKIDSIKKIEKARRSVEKSLKEI